MKNTVTDIIKQAGRIAIKYFNNSKISIKENNTIVTNADLKIEDHLRTSLLSRFPHYSFLGEESGFSGNMKNGCFISDPIDGTSSYSRGFPVWGVCLGLYEKSEFAHGWFYMPVTDELFYCSSEGIFCNNKKIEFRLFDNESSATSESVLLTSSNGSKIFNIDFPGKIRSFGCTAANVLYVAQGKAMGAVMGRVHIWDVASVLPGLLANGGAISYIDGSPVCFEDLFLTKRFRENIVIGSNSENLKIILSHVSNS